MAAGRTINRITEILQANGLAWILPNVRQDFVVWNALNDAEFLESFVQSKPPGEAFRSDDFSPSKLSILASTLFDSAEIAVQHPINAINSQDSWILSHTTRLKSPPGTAVQELALAGSIANKWLDQYNSTNSWSGLVKAILENAKQDWKTTVAILFASLDRPVEFLRALVPQDCNEFTVDLLVHALLSNPLTANEQLAVLIELCHEPAGDPVHPSARILLLEALLQQRAQVALDFSAKWLEIHPFPVPGSHRINDSVVRLVDRVLDDHFEAEIRQILKKTEELRCYTEDGLLISHDLFASIFRKHLDQEISLPSEQNCKRSIAEFLDDANKIDQLNPSKASLLNSQLGLALSLAESGHIDDAIGLLPPVDEPLPAEVFIHYALARVSILSGDQDRIMTQIGRIIELIYQKASLSGIPVRGEGISLVSLGKLLLNGDKPSDAAWIFEHAYKICPNEADLLNLLATSYRASHHADKCAETLGELVALNPVNLEYRREYAQSLELLGDWEAGLYERTLISDTNQDESDTVQLADKYSHANCAINLNKPDLALKICNGILSQSPDDIHALMYSGKAYMLKEEHEKGIDFIERATQIAPACSEAWIALVDAQNDHYPLSTVIETLKSAVQAAPSSAQIHYMLGNLYLQENEASVALPELEKAVELSSIDVHYLVSYADALKTLDITDLSREVFGKAYHLKPDFPGLAQAYADLLLTLGELEESLSPLETLIESKTICAPEPYLDYARCVLTLNKEGSSAGSPMKALKALNEILQIDPTHAEAKALTAEALSANNEKVLAFQAYREALDTSLTQDPQWFERLSFGFGCVASALGKQDVAIAALQEASQVNPDNPEILIALSDAYASANLPEEAMKAARTALVKDGDNPDRLAWFADQVARLSSDRTPDIFNSTTAIAKDINAEALSALEKAIQLAPARSDLYIQLGYFQAGIGAQDEAQFTFKSIAELEFATVGDLQKAAKFLSDAGDHISAIACLEKGVSIDRISDEKHDTALQFILAQEYVINHDQASAINTLDKAIASSPLDSSLISFKIKILLDLRQPLDALRVIENLLAAYPEKTFAIDLSFWASHISRRVGDLAGAIHYAAQGLETAGKSDKDDQLTHLSIRHRALLAEIYRMLLQPEQAYQILYDECSYKQADFWDEQGYLDYVFLITELALETSGRIKPDIQEINLEPLHPGYSRAMAINARLLNKAGNYHQAAQLFDLALENLFDSSDTEQPCWSTAFNQYLTTLSIIATALDLGKWDHAWAFAHQAAQLAPEEPISQLNLAKILVLKAEFDQLCQVFDVTNHIPSLAPQVPESFEFCEQLLSQAKSLLDIKCGEPAGTQLKITIREISRWQVRAKIVFDYAAVSDVDDILSSLPAPDNTAAIIFNLRKYASKGTETDALSEIIKYARAFPRNPAVILQVALTLQETNPEDTLRSLISVIEQNPCLKNPVIAFCNILVAKIGLSLDQLEVAQQAVEKAISVWSDEPHWHMLAGQIYKRTNDFTSAALHLKKAVELEPKNITFCLSLGTLLFENAVDDDQMLADAQSAFSHILDLEPHNLAALSYLANTYYSVNEFDKAEKLGREALVLAPNQAGIYQLLSKVAIEKNDYQGAHEYATLATQYSPDDIQSTVMLAKSLSAMGKHTDALSKLNAVIPQAQEAILLHLERINILRKVNGPQVALNELKTLTNTYPEDFKVLNALSKSLYEAGELENAAAVAQKALTTSAVKPSPNEQATLHLLIGQVFRHTGQIEQAIHQFDEAIKLAPSRLEPYLELGLARKEQREYQQALQIFEQATLIAPNDPRAPFQAGLALKESKDYKTSETMLRRAVSLAPDDLSIRRQLAAVVALNLIHNPRSARNTA